MQNVVLINNSRTIWPTKVLMPFLSFSDNLPQDAYIILQKSVDNFEIAHKTCSSLIRAQFPLKDLMLITFSSPTAQAEVVYFLISNESPYFSYCKSKILASNSL